MIFETVVHGAKRWVATEAGVFALAGAELVITRVHASYGKKDYINIRKEWHAAWVTYTEVQR